MEKRESILDALNEEDVFEDDGDVDMVDAEEGELVEQSPTGDLGQSDDALGDPNSVVTESKPQTKTQKRRANKRKNKRKRGGSLGPNVTDINRFVLETCKRLKEKKSYMVYTAVGCLGVSALYDIVKEVEAIQACGGQMTADQRRSRTGGGILWNIIKTREPQAYKEITKKAQEFEKQFKRPKFKQVTKGKDGSSQSIVNVLDDFRVPSEPEIQNEKSNDEEKRAPVHERLRVPVSYDDDLLVDDRKDVSV